MLFLAIETSSAQGSLALFRGRDLMREVLFEKGFTCVRDIAEQIRSVVRSEGLAVSSLEGIAVSVGPGSYTGVRVGVTAAKTLGFALEVPVVGVESLRVLASNLALTDLPDPGRTLAAPVLDGRQRFLYGSLYELAAGSGSLAVEVQALLPQTVDLGQELCRAIARKVDERRTNGAALVFGNGAAAFLETASSLGLGDRFEPGAEGLGTPRARAVGLLAESALSGARWDREAVHRLEPLYLRVTEAERRLMEARPK